MASPIHQFKLTRYELPAGRKLGDWSIALDRIWVGALQLIDCEGRSGLGFCVALARALPSASHLNEYFSAAIWPGLVGAVPEGLVHRISRPRAAQQQGVLFNLDNAIDQALWDLASKRAGLPLYRYLGGTQAKVEAYASGLCFHLTDVELHEFYARAATAGYRAFKVKVGHPDLEWDVARLKIVQGAVGSNGRIMVDSNEAWTAHETVRRIRAYQGAGIEIYWIEDPVLRSDFAALRYLRRALTGVRVNSGEYLDIDSKLALIAADAVDVVNVNDGISGGLQTASACAAKGLTVTLGNTVMNIGAHLAAALPQVDYVEDSQLGWTRLLATPIPVVDGHFTLPEIPGHGLQLSTEAALEFRAD